MQKLNKCILDSKSFGIPLMDNFIIVVYEGPEVGPIQLTDIDPENAVIITRGDTLILPRNQYVVNSVKFGVLQYFSTGCVRALGCENPLSIYFFKQFS